MRLICSQCLNKRGLPDGWALPASEPVEVGGCQDCRQLAVVFVLRPRSVEDYVFCLEEVP